MFFMLCYLTGGVVLAVWLQTMWHTACGNAKYLKIDVPPEFTWTMIIVTIVMWPVMIIPCLVLYWKYIRSVWKIRKENK